MANLTFTYNAMIVPYTKDVIKNGTATDWSKNFSENNKILKFSADGNREAGYTRTYSASSYDLSSYGSSLYCVRLDFSNGSSNGYSLSELKSLLEVENTPSHISSIKLKLGLKSDRYGTDRTFGLYLGNCSGGIDGINECQIIKNESKSISITPTSGYYTKDIDISDIGISGSFAYGLGGYGDVREANTTSLFYAKLIIEISDIVKRLNNEDVIEMSFSPKEIKKFICSADVGAQTATLMTTSTTGNKQGYIPSNGNYYFGKYGSDPGYFYGSRLDFNGSVYSYNGVTYSLLSLLNNRKCIKEITLHSHIKTTHSNNLGFRFGNIKPLDEQCQVTFNSITTSTYDLNNGVVPSSSSFDLNLDLTNFNFNQNLVFGIGGKNRAATSASGVTEFNPQIIVKVNKVNLDAYMYNTMTKEQDNTAGSLTSGDETGTQISLSGIPGDVIPFTTTLNQDTAQFYHQFKNWSFVGPGSVDNGASLNSPNTRIVLGEYDSILRSNVVKDLNSYTYTPILNETDAGTISGKDTVKYGTPCQIVLNKTGNKYNFIQWSVVKKSGDDPGNPETTISDDQITFDFECKGDYDVYAILEIAFENNAIVYTIANGDNSIRKVKSYLYFKKGDTFNNVKIFYFGNGKHVYEIEDFSV